MYYVYLLEMANGKIYVGFTSDLKRRFQEHVSGKGGKTTRSFGVSRLLYSETLESRSAAMKREHELKKWPRAKKLALIAEDVESARAPSPCQRARKALTGLR